MHYLIALALVSVLVPCMAQDGKSSLDQQHIAVTQEKGTPVTAIRYRWVYSDKITGKPNITSYWSTREQIRVEHPGATPLEGSEQVLKLADDPIGESMARFHTGTPER